MENQDPVIFSAVRSVLPFFAGIVAQAGIMTQDQAMTVGGGILAIASVVWSIIANRKRNTVSKWFSYLLDTVAEIAVRSV